MIRCGSTWRFRGNPVLIGLGGLAIWAASSQAGQPIAFSSPKEEVDMPAEKQVRFEFPRTPMKWDYRPPENNALPPMPIMLIDPRIEKQLREQREENRNWMFKEPSLFKDKLRDPFAPAQATVEDAFKGWNDNVDRVFGKTEENDRDRRGPNERSNPFYSDNPLFDRDNRGKSRMESTSLDSRDPSLAGPFKNSAEAAMKALFDQRIAPDKAPMLPGMSLSETIGAANTKSLKQERKDRDNRREEFNRLLSPQAGRGGQAGEPGRTFDDQTRSPLNPVTPNPPLENRLPEIRGLDPILPANPAERLAHHKLPYEELMDRYKSPVPPPPAPENKKGQLEALKLMTRPSILSFPGRQF